MPGKRKSDATTNSSISKKSKTKASTRENDHAYAKAILATIDAGFETSKSKSGSGVFDLGDENAVRKAFADIANYVSSLEDEVKELKREVAEKGERSAPAAKSPEQISIEAGRLREHVTRGIKRLLTWKANCKTNTAKFVHDGICPDPLVFGAMLRLDGPPKFKMKKMLGAEFEDLIGEQIRGCARYNELFISKENVTIRYDAGTGAFKISGSYGISP